MFRRILWGAVMTAVALTTPKSSYADATFESLAQDQRIADFAVSNLYEDASGQAMGARFRHTPSGFVLDVLRIQSLPQAFVWVNSSPPSDQGEPHTCEHLLLGKGTKGRYVASLEDMSLGRSSAFTMQLETCYHYNTSAGNDVFFNLLEAKLDAMINPSFSDEEIRREVCNIGVTVDSDDSTLAVEEKGTVYNEMVSTYERPWSPLFYEMGLLQYGKGHPMSNESGGAPAAIRTMVPGDLRKFHGSKYHLNNMGMIIAVADDIEITEALATISGILARVEPDATVGKDPATAHFRMPPPKPAPEGMIELVSFPHQNPDEPGHLVFGWQPTRNPSNLNLTEIELLFANLAGGETSNLYRKFIDSQTRAMDIGASDVFDWVTEDYGYPIYVGLQNVRRDALTKDKIKDIRDAVIDELRMISQWSDNSPELAKFNERAQSRIIEWRRDNRKFLNTPPGFGTRGTGAGWLSHLRRVQGTEGFRKPLLFESEYQTIEKNLSSNRNLWAGIIEDYQLLDPVPYAVGARPDPELVKRTEEDRTDRLASFVDHLEDKYSVPDGQAAIAKYQEEYDANTAEIEDKAATIEMPKFIDRPPLTLDDNLHYDVAKLPGGGKQVSSTFNNMTAMTAGVAFRMDVVPEDQMLYVAALPTLLTDVGVVKDGTPIPYDEMKESIRREISELRAYYSVNHRTERVELVLRTAGSDQNEADRAMGWLESALYSPDWRIENLPRLRDAIDLELADVRNTMRGPEEYWVQDPQRAYWRQSNPLILTADCFLTQVHALHRLRWRLKQADSKADLNAFQSFLSRVARLGKELSRDDLSKVASALNDPSLEAPVSGRKVVEAAGELSEPVQRLVKEAAGDLRKYLPDLPQGTLATDWKYLCNQMARDLSVTPAATLDDIRTVMDRVRRADNVRSFVIGSEANQEKLQSRLDKIVARLDETPSQRQSYSGDLRIVNRLRDREAAVSVPVFVGLVNENTRSGVHINTAPCASFTQHDRESLLRFLAARLYGGGGAHSMFMKTWGAGLAYSNGLRSNEAAGRLIYYAERCPDLTQTMQFVVDELKNAPYDESLAEYAIAQAFSSYRGGDRYESRGETMAADLEDGVTPEAVKSFRQGVLQLRDSRDLYADLNERMPYVYGEVLPGYGPTAAESGQAFYFVIGPEKQLSTYEEYLHDVEGENVRLYRLYPRDYWLIDPAAVAVN